MTQKGGVSGVKTRYNRLENYLRDTCLRGLLFATRGEFKAIFVDWKKNTKRDRLLVEPIPLAYLVNVSIAILIPSLNA